MIRAGSQVPARIVAGTWPFGRKDSLAGRGQSQATDPTVCHFGAQVHPTGRCDKMGGNQREHAGETRMSTAFREFLQEQAKKRRAAGDDKTIQEWQKSVAALIAQIQQWLRDSDPDGIIDVKEDETEVTEPGLGTYRVPYLSLRAFGTWIGVVPKARRTVGTAHPPQQSAPERAEGRVDITDELRRYVLYRFRKDGKDLWLIDEQGYEKEGAWPGQARYIPRSEPRPFDQEAFERALMSYLR
jgi:hypothetical protein